MIHGPSGRTDDGGGDRRRGTPSTRLQVPRSCRPSCRGDELQVGSLVFSSGHRSGDPPGRLSWVRGEVGGKEVCVVGVVVVNSVLNLGPSTPLGIYPSPVKEEGDFATTSNSCQ